MDGPVRAMAGIGPRRRSRRNGGRSRRRRGLIPRRWPRATISRYGKRIIACFAPPAGGRPSAGAIPRGSAAPIEGQKQTS